MKFIARFATVLTLLLLCPRLLAWSMTGHMIVAQIAWQYMKPDARQEADRLIKILAEADPKMDQFIAASTWMDGLKNDQFKFFNHWHFIVQPYLQDESIKPPATSKENVTWAIEQAVETLKKRRSSDFAKALSLRFLIHLVGDIHQPLHATTLYNQTFPEGDLGGNRFELKGKFKNLHSFWDGTAGLFPSTSLSEDQWQTQISEYAAKVEKEIPRSSLENVNNAEPRIWSSESHKLAITHAYVGIAPHQKPSDVYRTQAQTIIVKQLALGGYRLADLLNELLG